VPCADLVTGEPDTLGLPKGDQTMLTTLDGGNGFDFHVAKHAEGV
jgi:hypothetical protein